MFDRFRRRPVVLPVDLDVEWLAAIQHDDQAFAAWVANSQDLLHMAVEAYAAFVQGKVDHTRVTAAYCALGHVGRQMATIDAAVAAAQD